MRRGWMRTGAWLALSGLSACGGASLGAGGEAPPGATQIAPAGDLLLDVSSDGLYALLVAVPGGALSVLPLAPGATPIPVGSLGPLPALPLPGRFQLPYGQFVPAAKHGFDVPLDFFFVASATRPDGSLPPTPLFLGRVPAGPASMAMPIDPAFGGPIAFAPDGSSLLFVGGAGVPPSTPAQLRRVAFDTLAVTTLAGGVSRPVLDYLPDGIGVASWVDPTLRPFLDTVDGSGRALPLAYPFPTYVYEQPVGFRLVGTHLVVLQTDRTTDRTHLLAYPPVPWSAPPVDLAAGATTFAAAGRATVAYTTVARESGLLTVPVTGGAPVVIASSGVEIVYDASPSGRYIRASGARGMIFDSSHPGDAPVAEMPCLLADPFGDTCAFRADWGPRDDYLLDFGWDLGLAPSPPFPFGGYYPFDLPTSIALATPGTSALALPGTAVLDSYQWAPPLFADPSHVLLERLDHKSAAGDLYDVDLTTGAATPVASDVLDARFVPSGAGTILFTVGPVGAPAGVYEAALP